MTSTVAQTPRFALVRPASVDEAVALGGEAGEAGRYWAGGTDLILEWQRRQRAIDTAIDLTRLAELRGIEIDATEIRIGALTTLTDLERAADLHRDLAALARTAAVMCTPQTRTIATLGGNLGTASPAADLAPLLIALRAEATTRTAAGGRAIPLEGLFTGPKRTCLEPGELITAVTIPVDDRRELEFGRIARTVVDIALVHAGCALSLGADGRTGHARIALGSVGPTPLRARPAEDLLDGLDPADLDADRIAAAAAAAAAAATPIDDIRTSAAYRRHTLEVLVRRSLTAIASRLSGEEAR